jgi:lipopolysaccharide transport system ATP-binding protein
MTDIAIHVDHLGKRYRIGTRQKQSTSARAAVGQFIASPFSYLLKSFRQPTEEEAIWAIKDVSFEVKHGEIVGIIGKNGSGKSTLLKILSQITEPTTGKGDLYGRVGSLLEVGTGFHPDLTGRENVYMNGTLLGMSKSEIDRKFDEIVDFAGVEKFIDTPVKYYSSGMYVRLGFAVAAHLEPEILIVDEVLAVGDAAFQEKCLGKIGEVAHGGRTVLFVSHNMGAVNKLCPRSILLESGKVVFDGSSEDAIYQYLRTGIEDSLIEGVREFPSKQGGAYFTRIAILDSKDQFTGQVDVQTGFNLSLDYILKQGIDSLETSFALIDKNGSTILASSRSASNDKMNVSKAGKYRSKVRFPGNFLAPGYYFLNIGLHIPNQEVLDFQSSAISFHVLETGTEHYKYANQNTGSILMNFDWKTEEC